MQPALRGIVPLCVLVLLVVAAGCSGQAFSEKSVQPDNRIVYIVYGSEKGDLSYTDAAYRGVLAAQQDLPVTVREFVPADVAALPALLNNTPARERPGLIITVGFQYAGLVQQLAAQHPDIRFLAIDTAGIGSETIRSYEITSYGDSYLAGVLAASATRTGHVGIIMGMETPLLNTFVDGYADGARAVNRSITVNHAWVHRNSTDGFFDPAEAGRIAGGMYRNGTDVIFTGAGISNTGVFSAAMNRSWRYAIGTDSDQTHLGPAVVLASAVKRVDCVVRAGIEEYANGTFQGGNTAAGLKEGATGIVYNPAFASYNATVSRWEARAVEEEEKYLRARGTGAL